MREILITVGDVVETAILHDNRTVNVFGRLEGDPQKFDDVPVNAHVHVNRSSWKIGRVEGRKSG